jgi:hypothetical protein
MKGFFVLELLLEIHKKEVNNRNQQEIQKYLLHIIRDQIDPIL